MNEEKIVRFLATDVLKLGDGFQMRQGRVWVFMTSKKSAFWFDPFNDIAHAWMIVNALMKMEDIWSVDIGTQEEWSDDEKWNVDIYGLDKAMWSADAPTASLAICVAAVHAFATKEQQEEWGL